MAISPDDVRRLAGALSEADDASEGGSLDFQIAGKSFAWTWMVREAPRKPRTPRLDVLAVRCPIERKEMLIRAAPAVYFDEPHYRGYPAVLVRLDEIDEAELSGLIRQAVETLTAARPRVRKARA